MSRLPSTMQPGVAAEDSSIRARGDRLAASASGLAAEKNPHSTTATAMLAAPASHGTDAENCGRAQDKDPISSCATGVNTDRKGGAGHTATP